MTLDTLLCHFVNWHTQCFYGFNVASVSEEVDLAGVRTNLGETNDGPG